MNAGNEYYLLLFDIKNSTKLKASLAREKFDRLENAIIELNSTYSEEMSLKMSINYGDEIAGLFYTPKSFYLIADKFREIMYPETSLRFVAIKGKIAVISNDIRQIGGTIFKQANTEMVRLKKENIFSWWGIDKKPTDHALTALSELSNAVINDMSSYQREVYQLLKLGLNQKEIAKKLDKYAQSVWDAIQRSKATNVLLAEEAISRLLSEINNENKLIKEKESEK